MGMLARVCVVAVACLAVSAAEAENYPNKPIRVIVPFAAAGPTDIIARLVGQKLGETLGQQFYIENIPGAGGNTGTAMVAKSPHDRVEEQRSDHPVRARLLHRAVPHPDLRGHAEHRQ